MSEKRNSLRSTSLKCVGMLVVALLVIAEPVAAEEPLDSGFTYQGNHATESDNDNETIQIGKKLAAN